jgi:DMSO/TMAO reductase YedYZ molybdopterin-dependent catalytic subunit
VAAAAAAAANIAGRYGLLPPAYTGLLYAPGEALTFAAQKLLTAHSFAREFRRDQISSNPFGTTRTPKDPEYLRMRESGFADWRLKVEGLVAKPGELSLADLRSFPAATQITQLVCEEGWSYIAEWKGAPLSHILNLVGAKPEAKYVLFLTTQKYWWGSIDMQEALHPQTLISYEMNGGSIPGPHGGPMRLRVPRQLGYKSLKFINRMIVTDNVSGIQDGKGASSVSGGYSWYAGI